MNRTTKYTDDQLRIAVAESISVRQTLKRLGMYPQGGNYVQIKRRIDRLENCSTSHFYGQAHGTSISRLKRPIEEYLKKNSIITSSNLRKRLVKEGILINECSNCKISSWMDNVLILHLDHIDGDNSNNSLSNLRILCPNCHSQTETYCRGTRRKATTNCIDCSRNISIKFSRCRKCASARIRSTKFKIMWPSVYEIEDEVRKTSYKETAKRLGVSDNAVRKHLKFYGCVVRKYNIK